MDSFKMETCDNDRCNDTDYNDLMSVSIKMEPCDNDRYTDYNDLMPGNNEFESNRLDGLPTKKKTIICRDEEVPYHGHMVIKPEITIEEEIFGYGVLDMTQPLLTSTDEKSICSLCDNQLGGSLNISVSRKKTVICRDEEVRYHGNMIIKSDITIEEEIVHDEVLDTLSTSTEQLLTSNDENNSLCDKQLSTKSSILHHLCIYSSELFECEICYKKLPANMQQQMLTHAKNKMVKCNLCDRRFLTPQCLQRHMNSAIHTKYIIEKKFETPFKCNNDKCEIKRPEKIHSDAKQRANRFPTSTNLSQHESTHSKDNQCDQCDNRFATKYFLKKHKISVHSITSRLTKQLEKRFKCEYCDKKFLNRLLVIKHERYHTAEKPFECEHCMKRYQHSAQLQQHKISHLEKTISCGHCKQRFAVLHQLRRHEWGCKLKQLKKQPTKSSKRR